MLDVSCRGYGSHTQMGRSLQPPEKRVRRCHVWQTDRQTTVSLSDLAQNIHTAKPNDLTNFFVQFVDKNRGYSTAFHCSYISEERDEIAHVTLKRVVRDSIIILFIKIYLNSWTFEHWIKLYSTLTVLCSNGSLKLNNLGFSTAYILSISQYKLSVKDWFTFCNAKNISVMLWRILSRTFKETSLTSVYDLLFVVN